MKLKIFISGMNAWIFSYLDNASKTLECLISKLKCFWLSQIRFYDMLLKQLWGEWNFFYR